MPPMGAEINCDTLAFSPHSIPIWKVSTEDYLRQAAEYIFNLLTNPISHLPFLHVGDKTQNAMLQIAQMLNRSIDNIIDLNLNKPPINQKTPTSNTIKSFLPSNNKYSQRVQINNSHDSSPPRV